jgi:uncharacterized protein with HEPN domain
MQQRLHDVLESCAAISGYIAGQDFDDYMQNDLVRDGVERRLEVIGEALNRARQLDPGIADRIPELQDVVGLRNRLAHGYESIDDRIIWDVVHDRLPALEIQVAVILNEQ